MTCVTTVPLRNFLEAVNFPLLPEQESIRLNLIHVRRRTLAISHIDALPVPSLILIFHCFWSFSRSLLKTQHLTLLPKGPIPASVMENMFFGSRSFLPRHWRCCWLVRRRKKRSIGRMFFACVLVMAISKPSFSKPHPSVALSKAYQIDYRRGYRFESCRII